MRYLYPSIEQLDLAGQQLHQSNPSYSRFALILTDNIVELMLHTQCEKMARREEYWARFGKTKHAAKVRQEALGQFFEPKVKFCQKIGKITGEEMEFILFAHGYRNELYHSGIRHDDMIYALAWQYHEIACALFGRFIPSFFAFGSDEIVSDAVRQHVGDDIFRFSFENRLPEIARSLAATKPSLKFAFAQLLSASLVRRIQRVGDKIVFLTDDNPDRMNEEEVIFQVQAWKYLRSDKKRGIQFLIPSVPDESIENPMAVLRRHWRAPITTNPVKRWESRAERMQNESNPYTALKKHEQLSQEISDFEDAVNDAATALDGFIQMQIDQARGK